MLSYFELEEIIKAWPDKDGKSSNPEVYKAWLEQQKQLPLDIFEGVFDKHTEDGKVDQGRVSALMNTFGKLT